MRNVLLLAIILCCIPSFGATWYAGTSSANIDAVTWYPTSTGSCTGSGTPLVWASRATGDVFNANGCTSIAVNVDPGSASVQVTLTTDATNGGGFTYATASNLIMHAHITSTKTIALAITGSTGGGAIVGNITGGNATSIHGVSDSHTGVAVSVTGNAAPGTGSGANGYNYTGATGGVSISGNCQGSDTNTGVGCSSSNVAPITVTGNLIAGKRAQAAYGTIIFTPAAGNYALWPKDSSYTLGTIGSHATEMPTDPGAGNVRLGTGYGTFTGTLPVSGGGVCITGGW